jgi:hypothetical protein
VNRVLDGVTASSVEGLFSGLHVVENADVAQDHLDQLALIVPLQERKTERETVLMSVSSSFAFTLCFPAHRAQEARVPINNTLSGGNRGRRATT